MGLCWRLPWGTFLLQLQGLVPAFSKAASQAARARHSGGLARPEHAPRTLPSELGSPWHLQSQLLAGH